MSAPFDPMLALRTLNAHGVRYLVIGGFAGDLLGAPLTTNDLDVCYEREIDNMDRLAAALAEMHATLRVPGVTEPLPFILEGRTLAAGDTFTFDTDAGPLDVLGTPSGTAGFGDLQARAQSISIDDDLDVLVVDLVDLMRMKRASGRVKDRAHLEVLAAMQEMIAEDGAQASP